MLIIHEGVFSRLNANNYIGGGYISPAEQERIHRQIRNDELVDMYEKGKEVGRKSVPNHEKRVAKEAKWAGRKQGALVGAGLLAAGYIGKKIYDKRKREKEKLNKQEKARFCIKSKNC